MSSALKVIAATGIFAVLHSALASHQAKQSATRVVGQRNRNGLYRLFYIGQSVCSFTALAYYIRQQPTTVLYDLKGRQALPLRATQLAGLGLAIAAAHEVGLVRVSGLSSFRQWQREDEVEPEPEAQGPAAGEDEMEAGGLFKWSRHPLNFWPLLVLWFNPRMTTNLLSFNAAATAYLAVGSLHEEVRLRAAYGTKYRDYQLSQVPFYVPRPARLLTSSVHLETDKLRDTD